MQNKVKVDRLGLVAKMESVLKDKTAQLKTLEAETAKEKKVVYANNKKIALRGLKKLVADLEKGVEIPLRPFDAGYRKPEGGLQFNVLSNDVLFYSDKRDKSTYLKQDIDRLKRDLEMLRLAVDNFVVISASEFSIYF